MDNFKKESESGPLDSTLQEGKKDFTPEFPVKDWDRYSVLGYLGGGGMGQVFLAYDPSLDRKVALKFLGHDEPKRILRFKNEAMAQARIEHDCICKVYEVGEVQGKSYIAMQYIEGRLLNDIAKELTLEQKILLIRDTSWALHEAHRQGLIHRDIKPGNIIVEQKTDGSYHPFLMDFGLAKEVEVTGMTMTGMVMGTPHYMSPEQARGEVSEMDRRTDVYSMGATLYEILMGETPFEGKSFYELMFQVQHEMPKDLTHSKGHVPRDLHIITFKCLMKEKDQRYGSARELAEDLTRYLDGDPIKARPASVVYKVKTLIRKYKLAFSVAAVAAVFIVAALGWGIYTRVRASMREEMIQTFSEKIEKMDAIARYSSMLPIHDLAGDRQKIQNRIEENKALIQTMGEMGEGPGNYAIGRGYMALQDDETAKDYLEKAWNHGYRDPRVAYSLGRVFTSMYQKNLNEVDSITDSYIREARRKEIRTKYLEPAIDYLRQSHGVDTESPEYLDALLAFLEGKYDVALEKTDQAFKRLPWLYEALILQGDVYVARGKKYADKGDYKSQAVDFGQAESTFFKAKELARSDSKSYKKLLDLFSDQLNMILYEKDGDDEIIFSKEKKVLDEVKLLEKEDAEIYIKQGQMLRLVGNIRKKKGQDPRVYFNEALEVCKAASKRYQKNSTLEIGIANSYVEIAKDKLNKGESFENEFTLAEEHFRMAQEISPNNKEAMEYYGLFLMDKATTLMQVGQDPVSTLKKCINIQEDLINNFEVSPYLLVNYGVSLFYLARYESFFGQDPVSNFEKAMKSYRDCISLNPNYLVAYNNLGEAAWALAEVKMNRGMDPTETLETASLALEKGIKINNSLHNLHDGVGTTNLLLGTYKKGKGEDPWSVLQKAIGSYEKSLSLNPNNINALANLAECYWIQGQYLLESGLDPINSFSHADKVYNKAEDLNPNYYYVLSHHADSIRLLSEFKFEVKRENPLKLLKIANELIKRALLNNPRDFWSFLVGAKCDLLAAKYKKNIGNYPNEEIKRIKLDLKEAKELNPAFSEIYLTEAYLKELEKQTFNSDEEVLKILDRALELKENDPNTLAFKGKILLRKARRVHSNEKCDGTCKKASNCLEDALGLKPNLKNKYLESQAEIKRLTEKNK